MYTDWVPVTLKDTPDGLSELQFLLLFHGRGQPQTWLVPSGITESETDTLCLS
jgi:hypothetical protein